MPGQPEAVHEPLQKRCSKQRMLRQPAERSETNYDGRRSLSYATDHSLSG